MTNNKTVKEFMNKKNEELKQTIGNSITFDSFFNELLNKKCYDYSIHSGYAISKAVNQDEQCINRGVITNVLFENGVITIELDERYLTEKFTLSAIKKVTMKDNRFYVIYNDNSYFKIVIE